MAKNSALEIGSKLITKNATPYIIAEIGVNHEGSLEKAFELIKLAANSGADAAKFQSYKAEKLAVSNSPAYWDLQKEPTTSQRELFKKFDSFNETEYRLLAECCQANHIDFCSTPFDSEAVEFLDPLMKFYKIASADITNVPMLEQIASKKKPVLISTGASEIWEIANAMNILKQNGSEEVVLLHCVLNYPTKNENANLGMINHLKNIFPDVLIGYSDHTLPDQNMTTLSTAFTLGAVVIEKHFTDDKNKKGNDHYHAMDASDLSAFRLKTKTISELIGTSDAKLVLPTEQIARKNARRSIVSACEIPKGQTIDENSITYKRPGTGISTLHWHEVIGMKSTRTIPIDTIIQWRDIS